ncbi:hypothetical protein ACSTK0_25100, partial [Vibrio parahaemolyticus]
SRNLRRHVVERDGRSGPEQELILVTDRHLVRDHVEVACAWFLNQKVRASRCRQDDRRYRIQAHLRLPSLRVLCFLTLLLEASGGGTRLCLSQ